MIRARRTPTNPRVMRAAISRAYRRVVGRTAAPATLDILTAQSCHETGRGVKMYNHNFGGIKGPGPTGLLARYRTTEVRDGLATHLVDGFRAYRSLGEGAQDYVSLLATRYSSALRQAEQGDVEGFAQALKNARYYTAPLDGYAAALRGLLADPDLLAAAPPETSVPVGALERSAGCVLPTAALVRALGPGASGAARLAAPLDDASMSGDSEKNEASRSRTAPQVRFAQ